MATATLTSKGQLTLPMELRLEMGLTQGSTVEFIQTAQGSWLIQSKTGDVRDLKGVITYSGPPVTIEQMEEAAMKAAGSDFLKSLT
jgi:antitoxin PrlF